MPPSVNVNFEIDPRSGPCQKFVTSLVVLLRPTESVMSESTERQGLWFFFLIREDLQMSEERQHFLLSYLKNRVLVRPGIEPRPTAPIKLTRWRLT